MTNPSAIPAPKKVAPYKRQRGNPRNVTLTVRVTAAERDDLAALAKDHGIAIADAIRRRLLKWELPRPERTESEAKMFGLLSSLSVTLKNAVSNLNGLARAYHSGFPLEADELRREITEVRKQVDALANVLAWGGQ